MYLVCILGPLAACCALFWLRPLARVYRTSSYIMSTCLHDSHSLPVFADANCVPLGDLFEPYQGIDITVPTLEVHLSQLDPNSSKVHSGICTLSAFAKPLTHRGIGVPDSLVGSNSTVIRNDNKHSFASVSDGFDSGRKKARYSQYYGQQFQNDNVSRSCGGVWVDSVFDTYSFSSTVHEVHTQDASFRPPCLEEFIVFQRESRRFVWVHFFCARNLLSLLDFGFQI